MSLPSQPTRKVVDALMGIASRVARGASFLADVRARHMANTRFARNGITSMGDSAETEARVTIAFGRRHASSVVNQTDPAALRALVDRTVEMARLAPEDPEWMPVLGPQRLADVPEAFHAPTAVLNAEVRAEAAAAAIRVGDERRVQTAGFFFHTAMEWTLASSAGALATHRATEAQLTVTARTPDGTGSGWAGIESHRASDLDAGALATVAADKALRSAKPRALPPGRYTVVLEPAAVAELLSFLAGDLDARSADEGRSFFTKAGGGTRVGEKLFADGVTLRSSPSDPLTPGAPFDGEGWPLRATTWIDRGALSTLRYSRYWAAKKGTVPHGNVGIWHLQSGEAKDVDALIAGVERGFLVTRFWYSRWLDRQTLLVTGLTRDGLFFIENGKVTGPARNFRYNESCASVLKNADAMTKESRRIPFWGGLWRVPALRTHGFQMASLSEAV